MADLSKIKLNGVEYELKDAIAREAIENFPEDKIFSVNITLISMTEGTSDKSHTEILAAVNAGKIPVAYGTFNGSKVVINLAYADPSWAKFVFLD